MRSSCMHRSHASHAPHRSTSVRLTECTHLQARKRRVLCNRSRRHKSALALHAIGESKEGSGAHVTQSETRSWVTLAFHSTACLHVKHCSHHVHDDCKTRMTWSGSFTCKCGTSTICPKSNVPDDLPAITLPTTILLLKEGGHPMTVSSTWLVRS